MAAARKATILGCGSNVVDVFFRVRAMPVAGTKGYFQDPTKVVEGTVVGGVTLNHLSWAAALGAPTGLLALQGDDDLGNTIRTKLTDINVSIEHIKHGDEFATSVSHITNKRRYGVIPNYGMYNILPHRMDDLQINPPFYHQQIRNFAKKAKKGDKLNIKEYISNHDIKFKEVQLLDDNNKLSAPMSKNAGLNIAKQNDLDLVFLNSNQNVAICKLADVKKLQYQARRKASEERLGNIERYKREKTVKFKSNMAEGDIERQINQVKKFLTNNHVVNIDIWLLRRWNVKHESYENALNLASRIIEEVEIEDIGKPRDLKKHFKGGDNYFIPVASNKIVFSLKPVNIDLKKLSESKNRMANKKRKTKRQKMRIQREDSFKTKN